MEAGSRCAGSIRPEHSNASEGGQDALEPLERPVDLLALDDRGRRPGGRTGGRGRSDADSQGRRRPTARRNRGASPPSAPRPRRDRGSGRVHPLPPSRSCRDRPHRTPARGGVGPSSRGRRSGGMAGGPRAYSSSRRPSIPKGLPSRSWADPAAAPTGRAQKRLPLGANTSCTTSVPSGRPLQAGRQKRPQSSLRATPQGASKTSSAA